MTNSLGLDIFIKDQFPALKINVALSKIFQLNTNDIEICEDLNMIEERETPSKIFCTLYECNGDFSQQLGIYILDSKLSFLEIPFTIYLSKILNTICLIPDNSSDKVSNPFAFLVINSSGDIREVYIEDREDDIIKIAIKD